MFKRNYLYDNVRYEYNGGITEIAIKDLTPQRRNHKIIKRLIGSVNSQKPYQTVRQLRDEHLSKYS